MNKLIAIILDTFRELLVRKVIIAFVVLNVLGLVGIAVFMGSDSITKAAEMAKVEATPEVREKIVYGIEAGIALFFYALMIFVSIFSTASVVPAMLEKGTVDLYLSKPVSRLMLLFGKVAGSAAVVGANIAVFILGAWIILSMKLGIWNLSFLGAGLIMLYVFVVLYAMVVLFNVLTRGSALGIIVVYAHMLILSGLLMQRERIFDLTGSAVVKGLLNALYYILPQSADLSNIATTVIVHAPIASWTPVWTSALFMVVVYGAAGWMFTRKEF